MNFREYQEQATQKEYSIQDGDSIADPLLGVVSGAGSLSGEYKKFLRDGLGHQLFTEKVAEELGDILWYLAVFANKLGLDLNLIAEQNLEKCRNRWGWLRTQECSLVVSNFDSGFSQKERIPRKFEVEINEFIENDVASVSTFLNGKQVGNDLTDNAYKNDGYRFHDVFHLSYAAVLGWSPVVRKMLSCKRKSHSQIDEVEDGGRAIAAEEAIALLVFQYAKEHNFLEGISVLDCDLLKKIRKLTSGLEVFQCSPYDWEKAIFAGYSVWRQVIQNNGGIVQVDIDDRSIIYRPHKAMSQRKIKSEKPIEHPTLFYFNQKCG